MRILVADDQPIDRRGMRGLLETQPDFEVIGEASSGTEAIEACGRLHPDVVVMDALMPGLDGVAALAGVRAASPATRVVVVAERGERRCVVLNPPRPASDSGLVARCVPVTDCLQVAVALGAHGAIRRSAEPEDLFEAVRTVAGGHAWYEAGTAARLLKRSAPGGPAAREGSLTSRELEVAALIADGRSNKEIGRALGIREATVKKHVCGLLAKLALEDRLQLGLYVARNPALLPQRRNAAATIS